MTFYDLDLETFQFAHKSKWTFAQTRSVYGQESGDYLHITAHHGQCDFLPYLKHQLNVCCRLHLSTKQVL